MLLPFYTGTFWPEKLLLTSRFIQQRRLFSKELYQEVK